MQDQLETYGVEIAELKEALAEERTEREAGVSRERDLEKIVEEVRLISCPTPSSSAFDVACVLLLNPELTLSLADCRHRPSRWLHRRLTAVGVTRTDRTASTSIRYLRPSCHG